MERVRLALFILLWTPQASHTSASLRGVSAVSESVAWASGANGTVLLTLDGGATWDARHVPGAESLDFRDIEAFNRDRAFLMSAGTGKQSRIYKTGDGGAHWSLVLQNDREQGFFDAISFWTPDRGLVLGDAVDGRMFVATTSDGGATWLPVEPTRMPPARPGEGAFAASGTCLIVRPYGKAWFATGGTGGGRVFRSNDWGRTWEVSETPVRHDTAASGIFSLAFCDGRHGVAIGGDYSKPAEKSGNFAFSNDGGKTWQASGGAPPGGYRSAVSCLPKSGNLVAAGTTGFDFSSDGGGNWSPFAAGDYNAMSFTQSGTGWAVGPKGAIAKWTAGNF